MSDVFSRLLSAPESPSIDRIPVEILLEVICYLLLDTCDHLGPCRRYFELNTASSVRRSWKSAIESSALLWTHIHTSYLPPIQEKSVRLSNDLPLVVYHTPPEERTLSIDPSLLLSSARWSTLTVGMSRSLAGDSLLGNSLYLPNLKTITIDYMGDRPVRLEPSQTPFLQDPSALPTCVTLWSCSFNTALFEPYRLRSLVIVDANFSIHAILSVLSRTPELAELSLVTDGSHPHPHDTAVSDENIIALLPHLWRIRIDMPSVFNDILLPRLRAPNLTDVTCILSDAPVILFHAISRLWKPAARATKTGILEVRIHNRGIDVIGPCNLAARTTNSIGTLEAFLQTLPTDFTAAVTHLRYNATLPTGEDGIPYLEALWTALPNIRLIDLQLVTSGSSALFAATDQFQNLRQIRVEQAEFEAEDPLFQPLLDRWNIVTARAPLLFRRTGFPHDGDISKPM